VKHTTSATRISGARARCVAFYLPQYHPIPENDAAWGEGFTEWTNVRKARPLYHGHHQPVEPGLLGYYDLRNPAIREVQAALARAHGIEGFAYWHYWFNGRRLLERPFNEVLASSTPDFPFCLSWANVSWTGIWHGSPQHTIVEQTYGGRNEEARHFEALLPAFLDPRYMRIDGRPIFMVFAPFDLPDPAGLIAHWNALAQQNGLPGIYFIALKSGKTAERREAPAFDAISELRPRLRDMPIWRRIPHRLRRFAASAGIKFPRTKPLRHDYRLAVRRAAEGFKAAQYSFPCVFSGWDNTPRSGVRGHVYENWRADLFADYLTQAVRFVAERPHDHRILFVRSWNEWAEGNVLEPDSINGDAALKALRKVIIDPAHIGVSVRPERS